MRVQVSGQKDLYRLAHNLHTAGQKGLKRELDKASRQAGDELAKEVKDSTATYIPKNFEQTWDTSFHAKVEVRLITSRRITVVFWADAKTVRRDIKRINEGKLRHPVFGRTRRLKHHWKHKATSMANPWVEQRIRPGLVDEPAERALPAARKHIEDAIDRVSQQIVKG